MTTIYKTWLARFEAGVVTYGQMRQFCEAVGGYVFNGYPRGKHTNLEAEEADRLYVMLTNGPGLDLLGTYKYHDMPWKKAGRRWVAANGKRAGLPVEMVAAAEELDFRFVDIACHGNNFAPVYRAFVPDGREWHYAPFPWQVKVYG